MIYLSLDLSLIFKLFSDFIFIISLTRVFLLFSNRTKRPSNTSTSFRNFSILFFMIKIRRSPDFLTNVRNYFLASIFELGNLSELACLIETQGQRSTRLCHCGIYENLMPLGRHQQHCGWRDFQIRGFFSS